MEDNGFDDEVDEEETEEDDETGTQNTTSDELETILGRDGTPSEIQLRWRKFRRSVTQSKDTKENLCKRYRDEYNEKRRNVGWTRKKE